MRSVLRIAAGDLVSKGLLVGINLYLIRHLAVDEYSHFTVLLTAVFLGYQLACGPLERLYIAEHERYGSHLTSLQWVLSGASALGGVLWLWRTIDAVDAVLIVTGVFLLSAYQVSRIRLQQRMEFTLFSIAEILKNGMWLVTLLLFLAVPLFAPGSAALLALLVGTFLAMALMRFITRARPASEVRRGSGSDVGRVLWDTRHVIAYSLVGAVVPYLPIMMATSLGNDALTATYGAAMRYTAILGMAVFAVNTALLPQLATLGRDEQGRHLLLQRLKRNAPWALLLFIAVVLLIWIVIPYVDRGKYPLLPQVFLILAITPALSLASTPYINMLLVDGRARAVLAAMSAGLAVNLAGYVLLGSSTNPLAPAWASALAYLTITVATVLCVTMKRRQPV
ncbi:MAG: hypothetical protein ABIQ60_16820 [Burkholderiaceae bacterium]